MRAFKFANADVEKPSEPDADISKLVEIQTAQLKKDYGTDCLDAQQLQKVFNISQSSAYKWLKNCKETREICGRKVVPTIWIAYHLVTGKTI